MHHTVEAVRVSRWRTAARSWDFWLFVTAALLLLTMIVRTAWLSDDAYITLRTIDNWRQGFGLRWNVAERVQTYTHPLWMFAVAGAWGVTGEPYFSTMLLSIACAFGAALLLARTRRPWWAAAAAVLLLATCRSFVDYSTSGLETPLAYLLASAFVVAYWSPHRPPGRVLSCTLLASLLVVNRLDAALLVAPALAHLVWRGGRQAAAQAAIGLLPLVAWTAFAVVYYGAPVPNTAYAKLAHGIPQEELTRQGLAYLANSWQGDLGTLLAIAGALVLVVWRPRIETATIAIGIALHLLYVVRVGGDFMSGRFLAPALLLSVALLLVHPSTWRSRMLVTAAMLVLAVVRMPDAYEAAWPSRPPPAPDALIDDAGVADERRIYARETGLLAAIRAGAAPETPWERSGRRMNELGVRVMTRDSVGMFAYGAGPTVHIIDTLALCDPLMARLPARRPWRIGHFYRELPAGYVDLLRGRTERLADPQLHEYYQAIRLVTRGPIWWRARWKAMLMLMRRPTFEDYRNAGTN